MNASPATITTSALRFAFRAIYISRDDSPEDRQVWWNASEADQLRAEAEVRADSAKASWSSNRLTKTEVGKTLAALAW